MRKPARIFTGGFTLLEVILAAVIFVLLAGGVYFAVSTSASAAADLGREQIEARRLGTFQSFLRSGFLSLPAEAEISVRSRQRGALGQSVELIIRRASGAFSVGALASQGNAVVLGTVPDRKGKSYFSLARFPDKMGLSELDRYLEQAQWLPMLENVDSLQWRFWDPDTNRFVETWDRGVVHPELIELTVQVSGEPPLSCIFRLPKLVPSSVQAPAPAPAPAQ